LQVTSTLCVAALSRLLMLQLHRHLPCAEVCVIGADSAVGALSTAPIADHLGRRAGLLLASLIFVVGVVIQTAVKSLAGALSLARRADLSGMYAGRSV